MASLPDGVYAIARHPGRLLTLRPGARVVVLPPTGVPGEQEWRVETGSDATVTIRNLGSGTYLGWAGRAAANGQVGGHPGPRGWRLRRSAEAPAFHVVAADGAEQALDTSRRRIFPPPAALRPLAPDDLRQTWRFEPRG